jgi:hypothetical protein
MQETSNSLSKDESTDTRWWQHDEKFSENVVDMIMKRYNKIPKKGKPQNKEVIA